MVDRRKMCLLFLIISFFRAANTRTDAQKLESYTFCYLVVCKCLVCCFWFSPRFTLGFLVSSRTYEKNFHILIGCLFVNLRLIHEPCLGITIVSLYCVGSPKRKFSNYSLSEQRSGHITEIANCSYPCLNYG